jgi:hypothetical protein
MSFNAEPSPQMAASMGLSRIGLVRKGSHSDAFRPWLQILNVTGLVYLNSLGNLHKKLVFKALFDVIGMKRLV